VSLRRKIADRTKRRKLRVRSAMDFTKPRVSVFRSLNNIYAQVIDDVTQKTIASCSSLELDVKGDKKAIAKAVGQELAKRALNKNVTRAVFDRGSFKFHGRVQALAEGLREGGVQV
jgi:large subunit ribosomal protein L18